MRLRLSCTVVAAWAAGFASVASAQTGPIAAPTPKGPSVIEVPPIATGLVAPNSLTNPANDFARKFIVDQPGQVRIIKNGALLPTPFLDISATATTTTDRRVVPMQPGYD